MDSTAHFDYVVVDCHNLAYRSWWNNRFRKTTNEVYCGLEYGFIQAIMLITRTWYPARLILAWDGKPVRGLSIFPHVTDETGKLQGYKADRKDHEDKAQEPDWDVRLGSLREKFQTLVPTLYHKDNEADEQIAFFVRKTESYGLTTIILSNDEDLHQLVSDYTSVLRISRAGRDEDDEIWGVDEIQEFWGVDPAQLPLRWAIEGGGSIKGIPRIPKTLIVDLVNRGRTLEGLFGLIDSGDGIPTALQREKFQAGKDIIQRNYDLLNLLAVAGEPSIVRGTRGDSSGVKKLCKILEMSYFVDRREWSILESDGKLPVFIEGDSGGEGVG